MGFHIGTDVGGTFTDLWVAADGGAAQVLKTPTTADVMTGVLDAVRLAADAHGLSFEAFCAGIERFGHGTTVGLNALLTGRTAKTAILTTRGFGDTLEIGRMRRQTSGLNEVEVTDYFRRNRFSPIVPRRLVIEIDERIDAQGRVVTPLDRDGARAAIRKLEVEAVAICTLWSSVNPIHERQLKELVTELLPDAFVSVSHELAPVVGEYGRMSTTAANAALGPVAGRYLAKLEATLRQAGMRVPILMMTNAGGVLPTATLSDRPCFALFSGPAAGVIGSLAIGQRIGIENILTTDIGGTSFDVGVIAEGKPARRGEIALVGADIRVPSIDVASIGAGGGSIASVRFGDLTVGPQSAGSTPGPVCYGRGGTEPTATDADLVLGILDPDYFIGGRMKLDADAARAAIQAKIAEPLGLRLMEAAWGIREVLDNKMADLLRRVTIERGYDPRNFVLFANGGAGPSHAWTLARELGLDGFIVPAAATAQSAFGTANSDLGIVDERPVYLRVKPGQSPAADDLRRCADALADSAAGVRRNLESAGARDGVTVERILAMRYRGQTNPLDVSLGTATTPFDAALFAEAVTRFETLYERLFGRGAGYAQAGYEVLGIRVIGQAALPASAAASAGDQPALIGHRPVVFDAPLAPVKTAIYRTNFPAADSEMAGPCIIEFPGQSVVVPPGAVARADAIGNLRVSFRP